MRPVRRLCPAEAEKAGADIGPRRPQQIDLQGLQYSQAVYPWEMTASRLSLELS